MAEKSSILGTITKIIFIGGAIVLFALLAILIIRWVPKALNGVANIGSSFSSTIRGGETIDVNINQQEINSGESFVISFDHSPTVPGEYYLTYSCEDSLIFDIQSTNGLKRILCNAPFKLGQNIEIISLVPTLGKKNVFVDSNIKINYKDFENNDEVAYGESMITIKNTDGSNTASNPFDANFAGSTVTSAPVDDSTTTQTPKIGGNTVAPDYYGNADLTITNIARTQGDSALSFTVYNYGTKPTGNWYFSYTDAENPSRTLTSPIQPSLNPGQGLLTQIRFDSQRYDNQVVTIYLDSTNSVYESNESNNRSSVTIDGRNSSYRYNYDDDDDADLVIEDLEVGRMSGSRFTEDDEIDEDDDAAVRFTVRNRGGESRMMTMMNTDLEDNQV
jgi:hypothetical protein